MAQKAGYDRPVIEALPSDQLFAANRAFLRDANAFAPDLSAGERIEGLIHPREGLLLYTLARRSAHLGNIVEIGAYLGRSTWYLVQGLKHADSPHKVISIDPHVDPRQREAYFATLEAHDLSSWVNPRVGFSHDVAGAFEDGPVGMLWIDGDHSYRAAKQDFDDWFPRLAFGGWYAMHDTVNSWFGPTKLARGLLAHRSDLANIGVVWLTLFARKTTPHVLGRAAGWKARASFDLLTLMQARHNGFGPEHTTAGER
jgi:predicted O-methyltransferase YrrM